VIGVRGDGLNVQLVRIPIGGGDPIQLTHFDSEPYLPVAVAYSRNDSRIAVTRQRFKTADAALFTNFH